MQLLNNNDITRYASEYLMQGEVDEFLRKQKYQKVENMWYWVDVPHVTLREFRIPEINRISDHVMVIGRAKAVNLECKLTDIEGAIMQAKDHLRWCDYSIIIMPPDVYIANKYKLELMELGIGLFYWFKGIGVFEFIYPKFNRNKDKDLKSAVVNRIKVRHTEVEKLIQPLMEETFGHSDEEAKPVVEAYIKKHPGILQRYSKEFLYKV